jgi:putative hydrolase of the HAD superfamily
MAQALTVFFDLDETLIQHTLTGPELLSRVCDSHPAIVDGVDRTAFGKAVWKRGNEHWDSMFEPGAGGKNALAATFGAALGDVGCDPGGGEALRDTFVQLVLETTRPSDGVYEALEQLAESGVRLGMVTNGYAYLQERKIAHHGFADRFNPIIVSETAGAHKPDPRVFEYALSQADSTAERSWFVGDNLVNDIDGSERAGLTSVLYDPMGDREPTEFTPDHLTPPSHIVRRLMEVHDLVLARR